MLKVRYLDQHGSILLLHHYRSDLAHLSDFDSLVIGLPKYERRAKNNLKQRTSSICTIFAHFLVVWSENVWSKSS